MAVPKRKTSKARRDSRRSANLTVHTPSIVACPKCKSAILAHRACKVCGYYAGADKKFSKIATLSEETK